MRGRVAGGYDVADLPDPNDPVARLEQSTGMQQGQFSIRPLPTAGASNGSLTSSGQSALGQNIDLAARGMATSEAEDRAHAQDAFRRGVSTNIVARDPKWQALMQALFEAGANRTRTGARAGWDAPGFFDTQTSQEDQRVAELLDALSANKRLK